MLLNNGQIKKDFVDKILNGQIQSHTSVHDPEYD